MDKKSYYSNGKLLLSGEYAVLDGALALALPTTFGQTLKVAPVDHGDLFWESFDHVGACWFRAVIELSQLSGISKDPVAQRLKHILLAAQKANPTFLERGAHVQTHLNFPNAWGLGTSSTLINNIASWAGVDAFDLLQESFGGSGYDIACAQEKGPIHYQRLDLGQKVHPVRFAPSFSDQLFFVYLNQKQDSKKGIELYRSRAKAQPSFCTDITAITHEITKAANLREFESLLIQHEALVASLLDLTPVKERLFGDYFGVVKSLGAWGGDFVLATGSKETPAYFKSKGFETVLAYGEMIL